MNISIWTYPIYISELYTIVDFHYILHLVGSHFQLPCLIHKRYVGRIPLPLTLQNPIETYRNRGFVGDETMYFGTIKTRDVFDIRTMVIYTVYWDMFLAFVGLMMSIASYQSGLNGIQWEAMGYINTHCRKMWVNYNARTVRRLWNDGNWIGATGNDASCRNHAWCVYCWFGRINTIYRLTIYGKSSKRPSFEIRIPSICIYIYYYNIYIYMYYKLFNYIWYIYIYSRKLRR